MTREEYVAFINSGNSTCTWNMFYEYYSDNDKRFPMSFSQFRETFQEFLMLMGDQGLREASKLVREWFDRKFKVVKLLSRDNQVLMTY